MGILMNYVNQFIKIDLNLKFSKVNVFKSIYFFFFIYPFLLSLGQEPLKYNIAKTIIYLYQKNLIIIVKFVAVTGIEPDISRL